MKQAIKPIAVLSENYKSQLATNEYLLILNPHEELRNKIQQVKKEFYDAYQKPQPALGGKPHVTLVRFTQLALMEERIIQRLRTIAMGFCPFKVELKDYGSFPSHTVYIQVTSKLPIRALLTEVRDIQRLMKLDQDHKPHFIDEPHIPVARKLLPWQYEKGWQEYKEIRAAGAIHRRRDAAAETAWRVNLQKAAIKRRDVGIQRQSLAGLGAVCIPQNLPVATRQGTAVLHFRGRYRGR